jgi:hypothetical protein
MDATSVTPAWEKIVEVDFENPYYGKLEPDSDVEALKRRFAKSTVCCVQRLGANGGNGATGSAARGEFLDTGCYSVGNDHGNTKADMGGSTELRLGHWFGGEYRVFLKPSLASVPPGAKIQAAFLKVFLVREPYSGTNGNGSAKVFLINKPWEETGAKHACWTVPWTKPGCDDESDRDPRPIGEVKLTKGQMPGFMLIDVTDGVRLWMTGKAPKEGFLLKVDGTGALFPGTVISSEADDAPLRPKLIVSYEP